MGPCPLVEKLKALLLASLNVILLEPTFVTKAVFWFPVPVFVHWPKETLLATLDAMLFAIWAYVKYVALLAAK